MNLQNLIDYAKIYNEPDPLYGIDLPAPLDNEKCRSAIVMRCGLLEPIYGEPQVFREMIYTWFHVRDWNFKHLLAIIQAEYSPIENTDRYSEHTVTNSGSDSRQYGGSDETRRSGSDELNASHADSTSRTDSRTRTPNLQTLTTDEISAENASDYQPDSQHETTESGSETTAGTESESQNGTRTQSDTHSSTETNSYGKTETGSRNGQETYTEHTHGNIGVTSNVQLINEELSLIRRFNVYDWIAERIEETFFIMVY